MSWRPTRHAASKLPTRALKIFELLLESDSVWARFGSSVAVLSLRHISGKAISSPLNIDHFSRTGASKVGSPFCEQYEIVPCMAV
jgi:hypothetical protein